MYEFEENGKLGLSNKIKITLISLLVITFLAIYGISISLTGKMASVVSKETGSSVIITFSPDKPKVLEKMNIEMTVRSDKKGDFFLELIITQNGKTNKYKDYTFSLDAGDSDKFILSYTPTTIEKEDIVANLYSSDKKTLYDSKIIEFKAESDIGPFDIELVTLTNFVQKGEKLPFTVRMKNFGSKDVEINLIVTLDCFNVPDIEQSSFIYLNTSGELEKNFILPTCNETGQHKIKASVIAYGAEFVSSRSQYFETDDLLHLDFSVPDVITVAENSSYMLNVKYSNNNKENVSDIKPIVSGIPSSWFSVTPLIIPEIKSGDFSVAIITFSIPKNGEGGYPVLIGASGDRLFSYRLVELRTTSTTEHPEPTGIPIVTNIIMILFVVVIIGVLTVFIIKQKRKISKKRGNVIYYHS